MSRTSRFFLSVTALCLMSAFAQARDGNCGGTIHTRSAVDTQTTLADGNCGGTIHTRFAPVEQTRLA